MRPDVENAAAHAGNRIQRVSLQQSQLAQIERLRLGIVGLASSHVPAWIKYVMQPKSTADGPLLREHDVTALAYIESAYGDVPDWARVAELQADLDRVPVLSIGTAHQVAAILADHVDAVIIADRHHASHFEHAQPFVRLGIPLYIDKPLVSSVAEANSLFARGAARDIAVQSYSALRWDPKVVSAAHLRRGGATHVTVSGGADPASPYGGAAFYGVHTIEIGLAIAPGKVLSWQVLPQAERGVHSFRVVSAEGSIRHVTDIDVHLDPHRQQEPFTITSAGSTVQIPVAGDYLLPGFIRWLRTLAGAAPALSVEAMTLTVALTETLPR